MDHGPEGVASTLTQGHVIPGQRELQYRAINYHSRSLTKAEKGSGKIEGESLAVLSGIKASSMYLYGIEFEVVNDHMPLIPLYNNPTRPAPVRVERHRSKLRSFRFKLIHQPGKTNPADYGSRHPPPPKTYTLQEKQDLGVEDEEEDAEIQVGRMLEGLRLEVDRVGRVDTDPPLAAITEQEVRRATRRDEHQASLVKVVQTGLGRKELTGSPYGKILDELSYVNGVLVRGTKVLMPSELEGRAVALAHEGHGGIKSTFRNLRDKVWFPSMSMRVQEHVHSCLGCVAAVPFNPPASIITRAPPSAPWKVYCADYKGPIGGPRGYYFHVLIDTYSKWPEVFVTRSTEFERLFPALDQSFACHGYPDLVVHDGGPPYNSQSWKEYAERCGFETSLCTPEHPQANGQAEKFMSSIVKITHASIAGGKDPKKEIYTFLMELQEHPSQFHWQDPSQPHDE